jgi:K+-sensing histidine kinase KdpD
MELGADDYLIKPCTAEELLRAIASRLNKHSAVENRIQQELSSLRSSIALSLPHELRTPITSILSSVELLRVLAPGITEGRIMEIADDVEGAVQRLYRLIQNYLAYIQLELIARDPNRLRLFQYECLDDCVGVITETSQNLAQKLERSDDLVLHLQNAAIVIAHSQFQKVILELIDNAFKFSPPNTPVTLRSWVEGESLVVEVSDCGRGMTPAQIAQVGAYFQFDRHYYEQQGLGLGLVIARRIVDIYQGNLQIESALNEGTTVRASFRLWKEQGGDG